MGKNIYAVNSDGTLKWNYENTWNYYSSPATGADGTIYIATEGRIFALNPDGTLKWSLTGSAYASALGSNVLYIAGQDGILYAIKDPVPVANFTATFTNGATPLTVQFNDTSSYAATWAWDFDNDGTVDSTEQTPTYTYSNAGTYTVKLTVTNAAGSVEEVKTGYITAVKDITAPVPTSDLASGSYNTDQTVNLSAVDDLDSNPKIYYTLDGSDPTTNSTLYTEPINLNSEGTTTLKFIAVDASGNISNVTERTYTIDKTIPTVTANLVSGTFNVAQNVTLTTMDINSTKTYYTTDNSDPTSSSTRIEYTTPIIVNVTTTLKFAAVDTAGNWSPVYNETYTVVDITAPIPSSDLPSGLYTTNQIVNLSAVDELDLYPKLYYTLNDSDPTTSSTLYTEPINLNSEGTTILKFIAVDATGNLSNVVTRNYTIDKTVPTVSTVDPMNSVAADKAIKITFSESIKTGTGWIELQNSNGTIIPITTINQRQYVNNNTNQQPNQRNQIHTTHTHRKRNRHIRKQPSRLRNTIHNRQHRTKNQHS